jgi:porin
MNRHSLTGLLTVLLAPISFAGDPEETVTVPDLAKPLCDERLLGDVWGLRQPQETGIDFRLEATNFYHGVIDGDRGLLSLDDSSDLSFAGRLDLFVDIDGEKAGLWPGLFVNIHAEQRYGNNSRQAGVLSPVNAGLISPDVEGEAFALTNVTITQALSESFLLTIGKMNTMDAATKNFYGGGGREGFMNANFAAAPIAGRTVPISTLGVAATWLKDGLPFINLTVIDALSPIDKPGWDDLSSDEITVLADITFQSRFGGLPGSHTFGLAHSNIETESLKQTDIGLPPGLGGEVALTSDSWSVSYLGEQFLTQNPNDPTRGWGTFLFLGYSDGDPNAIQFTGAAGLMAKGVGSARPCDTFGIGVYYNEMSGELKDTLTGSALINLEIQDEWGAEIFYDAAITDWFHLGVDLQLSEPVLGRNDPAVFGGLRSRIIF